MLSVLLHDDVATRALGRCLAQQWQALPPPQRPVLLLQGDLGAGKTTLVQGIATALDIAEQITSPSYALAQHYHGGNGALVHLDLYRLEQTAAADELYAQEEEAALESGALLAVEWPERLGVRPGCCWRVELTLLEAQDPALGRLVNVFGIEALPMQFTSELEQRPHH